MKYLFALALLLITLKGFSQDSTAQSVEIYSTNGGEFIFSFANVDVDGADASGILRFSGFFHVGQKWHFDFGNNFGLYTGYGIRNIGFITEDDGISIEEFADQIEAGDDVKIKRRAYTLGIPAAFKIGNFDRNAFVYAGAELELLFNYKEKLFIDDDKEDKYNEWFSDRTNLLMPSVFGGLQFPGGINLQFKYYLLDFLNQDYTERVNGVNVMPYENVDSRLFYLSVSFNIGGGDNLFSSEPPVQRRTSF
ncbi:MAG: hypothetical protein RIC19_24685 [Phaeodactylibacter sp.]|uniref:hypothetical protein n=1 Tax=Phaeodactylibacter sp. TaxID=1940289 RepID=UPI0032F09335